MKRNIIVFGIISGLIPAGVLAISTIAYKGEPYMNGYGMLVGYASMIIAFSLIFVAIKKDRDGENNGIISFGRAIKIGLLITLIGSTIYVLTWVFVYQNFIPDFMDKYIAYELKLKKESGASEEQLIKMETEMAPYREIYKSPLKVFFFTYIEIVPVGLLISLIAALILRRKIKPDTVN